MDTSLTSNEINRYSRHILLPDVGLEGQCKLKASSVLIVGTGGLGSPVSLYLAAAGIGRIGLVDYDSVEENNLHRQIIHGIESVGKRKVESARARLLDLNPYVQVDIYDELFDVDNAFQISKPYDVIIDCADNFATRYLINDLCVLSGKPDIFGAVFRFDGQASVFYAKRGPCYRCLFPESPPQGAYLSCSEGGVLGALPGIIGIIQATETIKILLDLGASLIGQLLLYNALDMSFEKVVFKKLPTCKICGPQPEITDLVDYPKVCIDISTSGKLDQDDPSFFITPHELASLIESNKPLIVDVREPNELLISKLPYSVNIPIGELSDRYEELDPLREIVLACRTGNRSRLGLDILRARGFTNVKNLQGGLNAWASMVNPNMPIY